MQPNKISEEKAVTEAAEAKANAEAKPSQDTKDPIKLELEREQERKKRSEKEKAEFSLKKNAERLKELGGNPHEILGVDVTTHTSQESDDIPEWYRREQAKTSKKTALELADSIEDEDQKALVKQYLTDRIVPSGDPQEDLRLALAASSALKNKQVVEELKRYNAPTRTAAGGSKPYTVEGEFVPTPEEAIMMRKPYFLTKEKILEARKRAQAKNNI